jgi:hypothetical protein
MATKHTTNKHPGAKAPLETIRQTEFIKRNIQRLTYEEVNGLMTILQNSPMDNDLIVDKTNGAYVKFSDIPIETIGAIFTYIHTKIDQPASPQA